MLDILRKGLEQFGIYYSKYPAYVVSHSDINPEYMVLQCNEVWGSTIHYDLWAKPSGYLAGYDWGQFGVPQVGDMVWLEFKYGNSASPLWSPGFHLDKEKPAEFKNSRTFGFKTPHGTFYQFDDDEDRFTFQHVWINKDDPQQVIREKGATIIIDKENVTITHLGHEIKLTPDDLIINTNKPINISSEKEVTIKSEEKIILDSDEHGLVLVDKLVDKLNALEEKNNTHTHPYMNVTTASNTSPTASQIIPPTSIADLENEKVKQ